MKKIEVLKKIFLIGILTFSLLPIRLYADISGFDYTNYYQLDYIQSSGTQYINTGINASTVYGFELDFSTTDISVGKRYFGQFTGSSNNIYVGITSSYTSGAVSSGSNKKGISLTSDVRTVIKWVNNTVYQDNSNLGSLNKSNSASTPVHIFRANYTDSGISSMKLYSLKLYDSNGNISAYYVPCERKSDGVYGVYDCINSSFKTNSGSGSFIPGSRIVNDQYTISTAVSPSGSGTVSGGGSYQSGTTITLTATSNSGYIFSQWSDGDTTNPRTITVSADATYTAVFVQDNTPVQYYTISTAVSPSGSGTVSGGGSYQSGTTITLTATSNSGYIFSQWSDGNGNNPRTVSVVGDATYTAVFVENQNAQIIGLNAYEIDNDSIGSTLQTTINNTTITYGRYTTTIDVEIIFKQSYQGYLIINGILYYETFDPTAVDFNTVHYAPFYIKNMKVNVNGDRCRFSINGARMLALDNSPSYQYSSRYFFENMSYTFNLVSSYSADEIIISGNDDSQNTVDSADDMNDDFSDLASGLYDQENDFITDFENNLVSPDFNINTGFGSSFLTSATWVRDQFNTIVNNTPFGSLLTFSLTLGIGLLIIGKVIHK